MLQVPDSPSSGLDTSSFLAPSQPAQVPRPALGTLSSRSAAVGTAAAAASDDVSVVAESDSEGEEEEEKADLLKKHSICSADGDESKDDIALSDATVMVSPAKQAARPDSQRWTDSALLGAATQAVGDSMTDSALLEAETQEKGCNESGQR
jgi:hypothetical protein